MSAQKIKSIGKRPAAFLGLAVLAGGVFAGASRTSGANPTFDEIASLLAGLPGEAPSLAAVRNSAAWKQYAEAIEKNWADLETKRLQPMRVWADTELLRARASATVLFSPFGGPDFLTAYGFFPQSESFVLTGLESCGRLPRPDLWKARQGEAYLKNFSNALSDFFERSHFITKHMNETIRGQAPVEGVLPLLCFFLKRTGHRIIDIGRIEFDAQGRAVDLDYAQQKKASPPNGVKILFSAAGSASVKSIVYFASGDLQDKVFTKESALHRHLSGLPAGLTTYVKSASYLMHYAAFTHIRDIVLEKSRFVLEDDTGIPYKMFKAGDWNVRLYGEYAKPIKDFSGVDQPDLKKAYGPSAEAAARLPFHLGYHSRDTHDALLLIERKR
jgi:hypothetical protein